MSKSLVGFVLPDLLTEAHFSFLGLFHSLSTLAFLGRCPKALVPPSSWGIQHSPGFTSIASYNGLFQPPCRGLPTTHLTWATLPWLHKRFHSPFTVSFMIPKPEPMLSSLAACLGWSLVPSLNSICINLICCSLGTHNSSGLFTDCKTSWVGSYSKGCLVISSATEIPQLFKLASDRFLGQKVATFFAKISHKCSVAQLLMLCPYQTSWAGPL